MADQGHPADLPWSSELSLQLLGCLQLRDSNGCDVTPKARKTRALLALVALSKGPVSRVRLIEMLWGDRGEEQAKASLRQALYELRSIVSAGFLSADRQSIAQGPKALASDLTRIRHAIETRQAERLADLLDSIDPHLLSDLDGVTPELDEWLRDERTRIAACLVSESCAVGEQALEAGKFAAAKRIADGLERLDPLDERVVQLGIQAELGASERAAALRRHARFKSRLQEELGIAPSAQTEKLLEAATIPPLPDGLTETIAAAPSPPVDRGPSIARKYWPAVVALLLVLAALAVLTLRGSPVVAAPTVAVLPFEEVGQKQGYFASGVSDEILNLLGHQGRIRVLGRITAEQVGQRPNSLDIAKKLGVTHLLDGSVRTAGDRVLVIVRLTRVADGAQLWSERYERRMGDIFKVQGDIASAVANRLSKSLIPAAAQVTSPEVYDRYLAARQLARERREPTLARAEQLLREAITIDPRYAPAYAELAQVIMLRSDHPTAYGSKPMVEAQAEAEPFARKAVALDPTLGDGYAAIGFLSLNLDGRTEPYFRKAVELSPQRPEFHRWHAQSLGALQRYDEAVVEYKRAVEIDPLWGLNYDHLIGSLYLLGRKDEARRYVQQFLSLSSDQRAKLLLIRAQQNLDFDLAGMLRTTQALQRAFPDERQMNFSYASTLAELGERRVAAKHVRNDPNGSAILAADWPALARTMERLGPDVWDVAGYWNAASLLVASGRAPVLVRLYDRDRPLMAAGKVDLNKVASPEMVLALRLAGRGKEADELLGRFAAYGRGLPGKGMLADEKAIRSVIVAVLNGDKETAIRGLDRWSAIQPLKLAHIPAMSLRNDPVFSSLRADPRFTVIDERVRRAINTQRVKAALAPISEQAWISDPKTLLTKN